MRFLGIPVVTAVAVLAVLGVAGVFGAAGDLNQDFGNGGKVSADLNHGGGVLEAITVQPDGKILIGGDAGQNYALARLNPDGTFDPTFAEGGRGLYDFDNSPNENLRDLIVLDNGKIMGVGRAETGLGVLRWNDDGTLDDTWDGDGLAVFDDNGTTIDGTAIVLQEDGKIVAAGRPNPGTIGGGFAMVRFNTDGTLDGTFAGGGIVDASTESPFDMEIDDQGRIIVVGGTHSFNATGDVVVMRFDPDGNPDATFDGDGRVVQDISGDFDRAQSVALQDDGKIVISGHTKSGSFDWLVARFNDDGSLDDTFAGDGSFTKDFNLGVDAAGSVTVFDGGIAVGGTANAAFGTALLTTEGVPITSYGGDGFVQTPIPASGFQQVTDIFVLDDDTVLTGGGNGFMSVLSYTPAGDLNTAFGEDGAVILEMPGGFDHAAAVLQLPGGKLLAIGNAANEGGLVRFRADGTIDNSFGENGRLVINFVPGSVESLTAGALQDDGKIIVVGSTSSVLFVARLNPNGSLDSSFAGDGVYEMTGGANDVAVQGDGKIVVAGYAYESNLNTLVLRLNENGTPDTGFGGGDGFVTSDVFGDSSDDRLSGVLLDGDMIVVGGYATDDNFKEHFAVVRYDADGAPDNNFGGDGQFTIPFPDNAQAADIARMTNGSYILAGVTENGDEKFAMAAVTPAGTLDSSFDGDGKRTYEPNGASSEATSVAVQPDGKIVVGGYLLHAAGVGDMVVARFNADGTEDNSFSGDGFVLINFAGQADWLLDLIIREDTTIVGAGYATLQLTGRDMALVQVEGDEPPQPPGVAWGDWNCDGVVDADDVFTAIASEAGVADEPADGCPGIGDPIPGSLEWGNLNCDGSTGEEDWLGLLQFVADLPLPPASGCPEIEETVEVEV